MWNQNQLSSDNAPKDASVTTTQSSQHLSTSSDNGNNGGVGGVRGESRNNFDHCTTSKDKHNITSEGGIDSGFLSGPQPSEDFDNDNNFSSADEESRQNISTRGSKSIPPVQHNVPNKQQKKQSSDTSGQNTDSGLILEDFIEDDDDEVEQHQQGHLHTNPSITTTAASPQQRGGGSSIVNQQQDNQMILKNGVDSCASEWFCTLSLVDSPQTVNDLGRREKASWEIFYEQNNEGDTQLHLACIFGHVDVVAALIRMAPHPCLFNIQNDEAQTSLHLAVIHGQPKILRMLLIAGAEPTARDRHGNTPLHLACISGDTQCVKALTIPISASEINEAHRSYGHLSSDKTTSYLDCARLPADLEIRNYDGERCVHLAAQGGHIDILRHLVWFGADINAREGKSGRTSLHIAIECCNEILANFLLEECSTLNIETETYAGLTAYQVACILDNPTMQNHLEKRGAETLTPPDSDYDSSDIETDLDDSQMYSQFGDPRYFAQYNGGNPINVA